MEALFFVPFLLFFVVGIAATIYWVVVLIEVARLPEHQYRAAGTEKTMWVLIVVLAGIVGALVWQFVKRDEVRAAAGRPMAPPPGWYPEPGSGTMRWWDGVQWTDARHIPPV